MKNFYDIIIQPRSKKLDDILKVKHIEVTHILPGYKKDKYRFNVNVMAKYYFSENNYKMLRNRYIKVLNTNEVRCNG